MLKLRSYRAEEDYWAIRDLVGRAFARNGNERLDVPGCHVAKFDYWYSHVNQNIVQLPVEQSIFLWQREEGQLVAAVYPEVLGEANLQVDPHWRSGDLEHQMLEAAEQALATSALAGTRRIRVWATRGDSLRQQCLIDRDYVALEGEVFFWERSLHDPLPSVVPPPGYRIRPLRGWGEVPERVFVSWKAFHPDEAFQESSCSWRWYKDIQESPLYREDLDLVAEDMMGRIVGFATIWYDPLTRSGLFEPIGVHPDHQRCGLGKALMGEGLHRLQTVGADMACLSSYCAPVAHHLYATLGFHVSGRWMRWERVLSGSPISS